jgi:chromosome segregation ATPase
LHGHKLARRLKKSMPQTFWEPEVDEKTGREKASRTSAEGGGALALSADEFSALEERVVRAVELVKRERHARLAAEERATRAEAQLGEHGPALAQMKDEIRSLRRERDQVRQRIERLLTQLDSLEL